MTPRVLVRIFVQETGRGFQATGRDAADGYLGTEFGDSEAQAVAAVKKRVKTAGGSYDNDRLDIVTERPKRPAKVGPDRYTR